MFGGSQEVIGILAAFISCAFTWNAFAYFLFREYVPSTLASCVWIALDGKIYERTAGIESAVLELPFRKRLRSPADSSS